MKKTWARKIACKHFNWMLHFSQHSTLASYLTGVSCQNIANLFSELKLVTDNLPLHLSWFNFQGRDAQFPSTTSSQGPQSCWWSLCAARLCVPQSTMIAVYCKHHHATLSRNRASIFYTLPMNGRCLIEVPSVQQLVKLQTGIWTMQMSRWKEIHS